MHSRLAARRIFSTVLLLWQNTGWLTVWPPNVALSACQLRHDCRSSDSS